MRILFVTAHKHLPELRGGMEVNTHELATRLQENGIRVGVLCGLAGRGFTGLYARFRIKIFNNPCPKDMRLGYQTWRTWNVLKHINHVCRDFSPDAIILQGGADFLALVTECLKSELPVICYLHTPDPLLMPHALLNAPNLFFIANSEFTKSLHQGKTIEAIIRPLMQAKLYVTVTDRSAAVFVNPAAHKGLDIVLKIAIARPDVPFLFVVNHPAGKAALKNKVSLIDYPNVKVVGPFNDMRNVYSKARIILAPSQWPETWGRIATEAHFSAIPVLASNTGGLREAVGPGGMCLAPDAPLEAWIAAFNEIWDDPVRYATFSRAADAYARRTEISPPHIVQSFESFVLSKTAHPAGSSSCNRGGLLD